MNIYNRTLVASSELFHGYEIQIDIRYFNTENEILGNYKRSRKYYNEVTKQLQVFFYKVSFNIASYSNCNKPII